MFTRSPLPMSDSAISALVRSHRSFEFSPRHLFASPFGRLNQLQRWRDLHRLLELSRAVAAEIDARSYDLVFAHPCQWTQAPLPLLFLRTPSVYYCQEPNRSLYEALPTDSVRQARRRAVLDRVNPLLALYRSTARRLDRQACRRATLILVNSSFMAHAVERIYAVAPGSATMV